MRILKLPFAILLTGALAAGCGHDGDVARAEKAMSVDVESVCAVGGEGRVRGRAPYDSAAAYTARALEGAGAAPGVKDGEGSASGFIQPVPLVRNLVGNDTRMELRIGRGVRRLAEGRRTFLLVAPGDADNVMKARPPVFVGRALHAPEYGVDDFTGLDLEGRAVLVTATPPDSEALARLPGPVREMYADPGEAQSRRMSDIIERGAAAILLVPSRWLVDRWDDVSALGSRPVYRPTEPYPGHVLRSPVPIASGEEECGRESFRPWIDSGLPFPSRSSTPTSWIDSSWVARTIPSHTSGDTGPSSSTESPSVSTSTSGASPS